MDFLAESDNVRTTLAAIWVSHLVLAGKGKSKTITGL